MYCPKLPVPSHAELSTEQTVYNTLVTVTCNIGFKHADGRKSKNVLCLDNTIWNDTDVECQGLWVDHDDADDDDDNCIVLVINSFVELRDTHFFHPVIKHGLTRNYGKEALTMGALIYHTWSVK